MTRERADKVLVARGLFESRARAQAAVRAGAWQQARSLGAWTLVALLAHGLHGAFWSAEDDRDDNGVRVCGVFGNLDRARPTARFRLVLNGHFVTLPNPWNSEGSERA